MKSHGEIQLQNENDFKLRPEDELLLYCARTRVDSEIKEKIISLINEKLDWDYLIKMASRHRLKPLLCYNLNSVCPEIVPEDILRELKDHFNANVRRNLLLTGELIKIMELLKAEGIDAVPYKGPVLAHLAYGNLSLREFGDIDIFIKKHDVITARDILISNEYNLDLNNISNSTYLKLQREYKFTCKEVQIPIEIHWSVYGVSFYLQNNRKYLNSFKNIESVKFANSKILSFNKEILILILSLHNAGHRWQYLIWTCDLAEIIRRYKLNWDKIIIESEKLGIKRILFINLALLIDLFDVKVPKKVLDQIMNDKYAGELSKQIKTKFFKKEFEKHNLIKYSILQFKMRESIKNGTIDLLLHIFAPTTDELRIISLPDNLFFFYYILRPFFLIRNHSLY